MAPDARCTIRQRQPLENLLAVLVRRFLRSGRVYFDSLTRTLTSTDPHKGIAGAWTCENVQPTDYTAAIICPVLSPLHPPLALQ
eukprot:3138835-Prymnesium_polylepis.1